MDFIFNEENQDDGNYDDTLEHENIGDEHDIIIDDDEELPKKKKEDEDDNNKIEEDEEDDDNNNMVHDDDNVEIITDGEQFINPNDRITSEYMSRYEFVKLVGVRATQISQGVVVMTNIDNLNDPIEMAIKEIYDNKCPLIIKRYIGLNKYEQWSARELIKKNYK